MNRCEICKTYIEEGHLCPVCLQNQKRTKDDQKIALAAGAAYVLSQKNALREQERLQREALAQQEELAKLNAAEQRHIQHEGHLHSITLSLIEIAKLHAIDQTAATKQGRVLLQSTLVTKNLDDLWEDISRYEFLRDIYFDEMLPRVPREQNDAMEYFDSKRSENRFVLKDFFDWIGAGAGDSRQRKDVASHCAAYLKILKERQKLSEEKREREEREETRRGYRRNLIQIFFIIFIIVYHCCPKQIGFGQEVLS